MTIYVNPGTEPVPEASEAMAWKLMGQFTAEMIELGVVADRIERHPMKDHGGRYRFELFGSMDSGNGPVERSFDVDMPGVESAAQGEAWTSPRLYVNGSSWLWGHAVSIIVGKFEEEEDS